MKITATLLRQVNTALLLIISGGVPLHAQVIITLAGDGTFGYGGDAGPATSAQVEYLWFSCSDNAGNLFVTDNFNSRVRKIDAAGTITTFAGNGLIGNTGDGGQATDAQVGSPSGITIDGGGNVYIAESSQRRVRKVTTAGVISTIAGTGISGAGGDGGPATAAQFIGPYGLVADKFGNLFIADPISHRVRRIDTSGIITTFAGSGVSGYAGDGGPATLATLQAPCALATDQAGNIYVTDNLCSCVRKITVPGDTITTVAGNGITGFSGDGGSATTAELNSPNGVATDSAGNIFISDHANSRIRKVGPGGTITTCAGTGVAGYGGDGGPATAAELQIPFGVSTDISGNLYICDWKNSRLRKIYNDSAALMAHNTPAIKQELQITPNANAGRFTVYCQSAFDEPAIITITNLPGEKIDEITTTTNHPTAVKLDVPPGLYLLSAKTRHSVWTEKAVVK